MIFHIFTGEELRVKEFVLLVLHRRKNDFVTGNACEALKASSNIPSSTAPLAAAKLKKQNTMIELFIYYYYFSST